MVSCDLQDRESDVTGFDYLMERGCSAELHWFLEQATDEGGDVFAVLGAGRSRRARVAGGATEAGRPERESRSGGSRSDGRTEFGGPEGGSRSDGDGKPEVGTTVNGRRPGGGAS